MKNKSQNLLSLILTAILLLTPFSGAIAKEAPDFDLDEIVITATKIPVKLSESGANVNIITKEEIEKMHYRDLGEALRNTPGFIYVDYGGSGGRSSWGGINGTANILVLIDGKRMNLPNQMAGASPVDFNNIISMGNIERIEIVKGSASALYGSDAAGGIVNVITKKGQENKTTLSVASGSFGKQSYGITHGGQEGSLSWYLTANRQKNSNFKDGKGFEVKDSNNDAESYSLKLSQQLNNGSELIFSYQDYTGNEHHPGSAKGGYKSGTVDDNENSWDLTYIASFSKRTKGQLKIYQDQVNYQRDDDKSPTNIKIRGAQFQMDQELNQNHLLTVGLDYYQDQLECESVRKVSNENKALYLQDRWKLNQQLTLNAGVRFDQHQAYGSRITPRLTLNYQPVESTNYYLSYNQFFKAPNLYQLYFRDDYGNKGNPNLKPEKGHSLEAGINHKIDPSLTLALHCFSRKTEDAIDWYSDPATREGTYININKQKAKGWDLQLNKKFTPELTTFVGYTRTTVEDYEEGKGYLKDGNIPAAVWNIGVNYMKDKYDLQLKGRGIIDRPGKPNNPNQNVYPQSTYWVWDTALNVKLNDKAKAFLKVNNIFNQYYAERSNVNNPWTGSPEDLNEKVI